MPTQPDPAEVVAVLKRHPMTLTTAHSTLGRLIAIQSEVAGMGTTLLAQRIEELTNQLMSDSSPPKDAILMHTVLRAELKRRIKAGASF